MSIDWKRKLTSRKFWVAVVAFITPLLLAFGMAEDNVTQIVAIVMAGADVLAYIIAEGMVDAANTKPNYHSTPWGFGSMGIITLSMRKRLT